MSQVDREDEGVDRADEGGDPPCWAHLEELGELDTVAPADDVSSAARPPGAPA